MFVRVSARVFLTSTPRVHFAPGKAVTLREGSDVTIVATGTVVSRALDAAADLAALGVSARVLSMPSIKPLDEEAIVSSAGETRGIVTVEEALTCGLGGGVAETVARNQPVPMWFVGVPDTFAPTGSAEWLLDHFGISAAGIGSAVKELLGR